MKRAHACARVLLFPARAAGALAPRITDRKCKPSARARPPSLQEWLNKNIHERGSLDPSGDDLMQAVTGSKLKPSVFLAHLRSKYSKLYKL